jgi:putative ABC transport system permease protein
MLFLAIFIALLGIANTLALSIYERRHEIGLLRAVGMTRGQVRSSVRWESVIIALFGTALGLVIGIVFGAAIVRSLRSAGFTGFSIPVGQLAIVAVIAAGAGVLAAIQPARKAAKLDILSSIATQ